MFELLSIHPAIDENIKEKRNCSTCHSEQNEESPLSGVETLHFIQGDIMLVCNYTMTEQLQENNG